MTIALGITALCLLLLGAAVGAMAVRAVRVRHWLGGTVRGLVALLLLALAALAATVTVGLQGYRALTFEEVAATVRTEPVAPQRFRATITLPDRRLAMYELAGDAFYVDAHVLKWHPWASLLGLRTVYELDRVAGRYNRIADERARPHTAHVGRVYALCLRLTADAVQAEERTQDAFVRAWERLATFRGESAFSSWLYRLTVNEVLLGRRAERRREQRIVTTDDPAALERPRPAIGGAGIAVELERGVAALPPGARGVRE